MKGGSFFQRPSLLRAKRLFENEALTKTQGRKPISMNAKMKRTF